MIYIDNHMYIVHLLWRLKWRQCLIPYRNISPGIRYPIYNFTNRYISDIWYLKHWTYHYDKMVSLKYLLVINLHSSFLTSLQKVYSIHSRFDLLIINHLDIKASLNFPTLKIIPCQVSSSNTINKPHAH